MSLCVLFLRKDTGLCIYHLCVWPNLNFLHNSQWITLLCFDLLTRQKMPFKVMHRKEVTHSNGIYERKSRGWKLAGEMGRGKEKIPLYSHRLTHWKRVTSELHDSYFRSMTITQAIPKIAEVTNPDRQISEEIAEAWRRVNITTWEFEGNIRPTNWTKGWQMSRVGEGDRCIQYIYIYICIFLHESADDNTTTLSTQSWLVLYFFCVNFVHSLIMWLIVSSLSAQNLHLLFCCVLSIISLVWLVLMALFCAAMRIDSVSLLRFPFLSNVHVFSYEMLLISHLKRPWSRFYSHFCFLVIVVLLLLLLLLWWFETVSLSTNKWL